MSAVGELKDIGYTLIESDSPNRQKYDFSISDGEGNVAWIWGDDHDIDFECNHPSDCIVYDDDEPVGECILCGSHCECHKTAAGNGQIDRKPHEWYPRRDVGGLMKKIVDEQRAQ